jgi:cobalt/nickel transport system permease protein
MHIMEGFLPLEWCIFWYLVSLPFLAYGISQLNTLIRDKRDSLPVLAVSGAFIFVLSSLKMPSVTGSSSHPTGTGLSAILFGPFITAVLGLIVLIFQALFLAHGGFTTLGANVFSMGIAGPVTAVVLFRAFRAVNLNFFVNVFIVSAVADLVTYVVTSFQLALAFPAQTGGVMTSFLTFAAIFAITQVPLAVIEGVIIALTFKYLIQARGDILVNLGVLPAEKMEQIRRSFE